MKNSRPTPSAGGGASTPAVPSSTANDQPERKIFNKKGEQISSSTEADVEREEREEKARLEREGFEAELRPVAGAPEIAHPDDREPYERQMALVTDWFLEMWGRMRLNDDKPGQPGHEARVELQALLLDGLDQSLTIALSKKESISRGWAGELLSNIGERIWKHDKKLCKTNAKYAERKKKLSGKSMTTALFPKRAYNGLRNRS